MKSKIFLVAGGALVVAALWIALRHEPKSAVRPTPAPVAARRHLEVPRALLARAGQPSGEAERPAIVDVERSELSPSDEFYAAKSGFEANIKLKNEELKLSPAQIALLVDDLAFYIELKTELDAGRAKVTAADDKKLNVTVPADIPLANLLRDSLFKQIGQDLTPEVSKQVALVLGDTIDAFFRNYGSMPQDFEVVHAPDRPEYYVISWTTAPLTTDPKATVTGALGDAAPRSHSATFSLSAEELGHGEYRFLQPFLEKSLPGGR